MINLVSLDKYKNNKTYFIIIVALIFVFGLLSYGFQTNFGTIDVQEVSITHTDGSQIVGKLYRPKGVNSLNPAPGILGVHGYNNDKDVQRGTALELARAGFVVLTIDQLGHGDSEGEFSTATQIAGTQSAYIWLARQSFVDGGMGVYGHSMGYISTFYFQLSPLPSDVYAPNASIFETFPPWLHNFFVHRNVLHIWAEYEEWYTVDLSIVGPGNYTEDMSVDEVYQQGLIVTGINAGLAPGTPGQVDTTYGDFSLGNAYREHYVRGTTHPGLTADLSVQKESVAWMLQALMGQSEAQAWATVAALGQTYIYTELFGGLALIMTIVSMVFLFKLLMELRFFSEVSQPMPERVVTDKKWLWWVFAFINAAIGGVLYIFFTHTDQDWNFPDFFALGMLNNFLGFYLISAAVSFALVSIWYFVTWKMERGSIAPYDLGVLYNKDSVASNLKDRSGWQKFGKTVVLAGILFGWMYLLVSIFQTWFNIEFRIFWTFMKTFTIERFYLFLIYLPIVMPFFLVVGGIFLFGQIRQKELGSPAKTQIVWWLKACFAMLTGLLIVFLVQYLPPLFRSNYTFAGWPFNPIMPLQLMSLLPLSALLYYLMVYFYRKTGRIYLGSIMASIITVWFLSVGGVIGATL